MIPCPSRGRACDYCNSVTIFKSISSDVTRVDDFVGVGEQPIVWHHRLCVDEVRQISSTALDRCHTFLSPSSAREVLSEYHIFVIKLL